MDTPAFPLRRLLIGIGPSAVMLLLAYFVFNYHQHVYGDLQSKRNFRALNEIGNQIKSKLDALEEVVSRSASGEEGKEYLTSLGLLETEESATDQVLFSSASASWRPNLQNIFEPLMRLDLFEAVVIAEQDGTVLVQKSNSLVRFSNLSALIQKRITAIK